MAEVEPEKRREGQNQEENVAGKKQDGLVHEGVVGDVGREAVVRTVSCHQVGQAEGVFGRVALEGSQEGAGDGEEDEENEHAHGAMPNVSCRSC